jgi:hypothetical protein
MLNRIVLNFGDNYYYNDSSSNLTSFLINLSGVLIGAFLAYYFAIKIAKRQRKAENDIEKQKIVAHNNENLKHLTTLVDNAILNAEKQSNEYFELSSKIKVEPYELHLVDITLTNDIERIKRLDTQKIFDAYTSAIKSNNRVENYSKLFHQIDFIGIKLEQMFDMHAKHNNFIFNDQRYIRDIIDDLISALTTLAIELQETYPNEFKYNPVYVFITDLLHKTSTNSTSSFSYFKTEFVIPLRDNSRIMFNFNKMLSNFTLEKTKRVLARLQTIEYNSIEHSKDCEQLKSEIKPAITTLKEINNEMKINVP